MINRTGVVKKRDDKFDKTYMHSCRFIKTVCIETKPDLKRKIIMGDQ